MDYSGIRLDRDALLRVTAWLLVLLGSLLNLLNFNGYPFFTAEVLIACSMAAALGLLVGYGHARASPTLSFLLTGLLVLTALDLNSASPWVLAAALGATVVARFRDDLVLKLVVASFAAVLLVQIVQVHPARAAMPQIPQAAQPGPSDGPPPLVHIILDNFLGLEAMSEDAADYAALKQDNLEFFRDRDFLVYGGAFSRRRSTANGIPQLFSFGRGPIPANSADAFHTVLGPLPYFQRLRAMGYRLHVLQTDYLDMCSRQQAASCTTLPLYDLAPMADSELSAWNRAKVILARFGELGYLPSALFDRGADFWHLASGAPTMHLHYFANLFPLTSVRASASLEQALAQIRPGDAYVAHLLLAHYPFQLDAGCRLKPQQQWSADSGPTVPFAEKQGYPDQVRCTLKMVDEILAALDRSPAGRDAIVILHGDHGSRLSENLPLAGHEHVSTRDLAMHFGTLFAIRAPGVAPGYLAELAPAEELLDDFSRSGFQAAPPIRSENHFVFLSNGRGVPVARRELPAYGTNGANQ